MEINYDQATDTVTLVFSSTQVTAQVDITDLVKVARAGHTLVSISIHDAMANGH